MKKLLTFIRQQKWLFVTVFFFVLLMVVVSFISLTQMDGLSARVLGFNQWLQRHHVAVLLWHVLILAAIYVGWGIKVDRTFKGQTISAKKMRSVKRFRWWLIGFVVLVDCWVFWL